MMNKPRECDTCQYKDIGTGYCPPSGELTAPIAIIGEAPGVDEVNANPPEPFIGRAGEELNAMLEQAGIPREACYITNTIRCLPPRMKPKDQARELLQWSTACRSRHLTDELETLSPNVIVPCGAVALNAVLHVSGIMKHRGSVNNIQLRLGEHRTKAIPVIHPSASMQWQRSRKLRPVTKKDWRKVARHNYPGWNRHDSEAESIKFPQPTLGEAMLFLGGILKRKPPVGYDIETTGLSVYQCDILCCSFWDSETDETISIPFYNDDGSFYWDEAELTPLVHLIYDIFADPVIALITQNGVFDESIFRLRGFHFEGPRWDACYGHGLAFTELPHNLGFLGSIYRNTYYWKDDVKGNKGGSTIDKLEHDISLRTYNCKDSYETGHIWVEGIAPELVKKGKMEVYEGIVAPLLPAVADMQATGVLADVGTRETFSKQLNAELVVLADKMFSLGFPREGNPRSKDELAQYIHGKLDYPVRRRTPTIGRPSMDKDEIKFLWRTTTSDDDREFFEAVIKFNSADKVRGTFIDNVYPDGDGYVRANWAIHTTRTGRLACKDPDFQNTPEGMCRQIYIAGSMCDMWSADYKAFESWIIAHVSNDRHLLEVLREGRNLHLHTAAQFLNISYEEAAALHSNGDTAFARTYITTKNYRYGQNYGASPETIHDNIVSRMDFPPSLEDVQRIFDIDAAQFPELGAMRQHIADTVKRTRLLTNGFNRDRFFTGPPDKIVTEAYNFPIQSCAADIVNQVHAQVYEAIGPKSICIQMHDSLTGVCNEADTAERCRRVKEIMTQEFNFPNYWGEPVTTTFDVDFKVGPTWGTEVEYEV